MVPQQIWQKEVELMGERGARARLRAQRKAKPVRLKKLDPFKVLCDLAHLPGSSPIQNRKKFAVVFRNVLTEVRAAREFN